MINRYPLWKNLLIIILLILGFVYSLPNIHPEKASVSISGLRGKEVDLGTSTQIQQLLKSNNIEVTSSKLENGSFTLSFVDNTAQVKAKEIIESQYKKNYSIALSYIPSAPDWLQKIGGSNLKLGLDLRGGVRFLMNVDVDSLTEKQIQSLGDYLTLQFTSKGLAYRNISAQAQELNISVKDQSDQIKLVNYLRRNHPEVVVTEVDNENISVKYSDSKLADERNLVMEQSLQILRNRITEIGVAEPIIQRQGAQYIVVELPGIQDTAKAKEIIGATATLSFNMVNQNVSQAQINQNIVPANTIILSNSSDQKYPIYKKEILSGNHIIDATAGRDEYGRPQVSIRLDSVGAQLMGEATKAAIGKPMATIYSEYKSTGIKDSKGNDILRKVDEVANVATIQARLGSNFVITGINSASEASSLALVLRSGALVAPISIIEERSIGPSLGAENVRTGITTMIWALILVMVVMSLWYRVFGVVSAAVLIFNIILSLALISVIPGVTLTLPGIAGLVLVVGMSVDANVLIFERIRDELRAKNTAQKSLDLGFKGAFMTIFDANLTTVLTALILYAFGNGPIKGFAITLSVGVAVSMFTAIAASRMILNWIYGSTKSSKLHI